MNVKKWTALCVTILLMLSFVCAMPAWAEDESEGAMCVLNLLTRIRVALLKGDFSGTAVLHAFCGFQQFRSILDACSGAVFHPTSGACAPSVLRGPGTNPGAILQRACVL